MTPAIHELMVALALLAGLVACVELGYRLRLRNLAMFGERAHEDPRTGLIRLDSADRAMLQLRSTIR